MEKMYLAHCKIPSISEADLKVSAATDLVKFMQGRVPETAATKQQHNKVLEKLITILNNREPPRLADG